jgi:hypothetical protein
MDPYPYGRPYEDQGVLVKEQERDMDGRFAGGGFAGHSDTQRTAESHAKNTGSTVESKQKGNSSSFRFTGPKASQAAFRLQSSTHGDAGRKARVTSSGANSARVVVSHGQAPLTAEERYGKPSPYGDDGGMMG